MDLNQLNQYVDSTCTVYTDGGEALFPGLIAQCSGTLRINIVYDADTCCPYWTLKPASGIYLRSSSSCFCFLAISAWISAAAACVCILPWSIRWGI